MVWQNRNGRCYECGLEVCRKWWQTWEMAGWVSVDARSGWKGWGGRSKGEGKRLAFLLPAAFRARPGDGTSLQRSGATLSESEAACRDGGLSGAVNRGSSEGAGPEPWRPWSPFPACPARPRLYELELELQSKYTMYKDPSYRVMPSRGRAVALPPRLTTLTSSTNT